MNYLTEFCVQRCRETMRYVHIDHMRFAYFWMTVVLLNNVECISVVVDCD